MHVVCNAVWCDAVHSSLVKFVRPPKSNNFKILDNIDLKYLTQLRAGLNDLKRCKFNHNFDDAIALPMMVLKTLLTFCCFAIFTRI